MSFEQRLAEERRARLAAERLLDQKSRELFDANRKLSQHARALSDEIVETKQQAEELRGEYTQVRGELEQVSNAFELAERRLWDSLETIRDGFAVFNADNEMVAANGAYLAVFDGLEAVGLGARYDDIIHLLAEEGIVDTEGVPTALWIEQMTDRWRQDPMPPKVIRLWSGQYIKLIDRRTPAGDIVSLNLNITEMMRMWAAVEAIPDGFVLYDHDDRLVMCNDRYREFYCDSAPAMTPGATFEDILRYGLKQGQYEDAIGREEEWLSDRLVQHQAANSVVEQKLRSGRWLRILEKRTPDGGLVGLRVDITEQKRQQIVLEESRIAAESANRAKSAFLANMSHELRTPMNGVVGMAELLCDTNMSEEQRLYAETIKNSGEALLSLLNDVLDYSKIEAEKLQLHPEPFDLERTIHEIVMLLRGTAHDKALELYIDYDMFQPTRFIGDRGRIRQVLTNLIGNAIKFTEKGHVLVRVVGLEADKAGLQRIHLTVEDTGIGIAPEMQAHIFGEFNQVEDQQNRKFEGTGLGLAISKRLVELMGGELWLDSEKDKGSSFGICLTLPVSDEDIGEPLHLPQQSGRVLVVDDHEVNRTILDRQLAPIGLDITMYHSATAAVKAMPDAPPFDLIITDHKMPGMDGVEFARHLRNAGVTTPILMLTSNPAMLREGATEGLIEMTLQKPVLRHQLYNWVNNLLTGGDCDTQAKPADVPPLPAVARTGERRMRVLAAEDNRTNRLVFSKMVKDYDIDLTFAKNGREAVEAFTSDRPDMIFMDISMPEMDGKEATRAIRALEEQAGGEPVPIVALTAHALEGDAEEILLAGLDHYLTKPLRKPEIAAAIRAHAPPGCIPVPGAQEPGETQTAAAV